jgi:hypothetical protein
LFVENPAPGVNDNNERNDQKRYEQNDQTNERKKYVE